MGPLFLLVWVEEEYGAEPIVAELSVFVGEAFAEHRDAVLERVARHAALPREKRERPPPLRR